MSYYCRKQVQTKKIVMLRTALHSYSKRQYPDRQPLLDLDVDSVAPDLVVEPNWIEYIHGKDPVLEAVIRRIRSARR